MKIIYFMFEERFYCRYYSAENKINILGCGQSFDEAEGYCKEILPRRLALNELAKNQEVNYYEVS